MGADFNRLRDDTDPGWVPWEPTDPPEDPMFSKSLGVIDPAKWADLPTPERQWALHEYIPALQATYLTGPGSAGKSLLAQQLCTCVALGLPFMGIPTQQSPAIYLTCEDDEEELHRRQKAICEQHGVTLAALSGKLHLVSLAGKTETELATFGNSVERTEFGTIGSNVQTTKLWMDLTGAASDTDTGFIALDNVAHLFSGNENIRHEVAQFVSLLNKLAMRIYGSVLFIGHPNKAGDSFSGSTAWENQVRSRLYLETPKDADGNAPDRDARVLSRQKSNYAENGASLQFRWHKWAFVRPQDLPSDYAAELAETIKATNENAAFLACLRVREAQGEGRSVGPSPGPNYAPSQFEGMTEAKGLRKPALKQAMDRLYAIGRIQTVEVLNKKSLRSAYVIQEVPEASHNAPHIPRTTLPPNAAQPSAQPSTTHTHISKDILGAASGLAAPQHYPAGHPPADCPHFDPGEVLAPGECHCDTVESFQ